MKKDEAYLAHFLDAIADIETFTKDASLSSFLKNKEKQYAVVKALEIIGEASKNISPALKSHHPEIPWKKMTGMRDKLTHEYFGVNLELVWETITVHIPALKKQIAKLNVGN